MANSYVQYTGAGSAGPFAVPFPYLLKAHVIVTLDGVVQTLTSDYTWPTDSTILFTTPVTTGVLISFRRSSSPTVRLVDHQDASVLTELTLDADGLQMFYLSQEAVDLTDAALSLDVATNKWDGESKVIKDVADPVAAQDAVTKTYVDTLVLSGVPGTPLAVASGGTGAATAAAARVNLDVPNFVEAHRKNAIINGDFNVWQRATSFAAIASGIFSADRWVYSKAGAMVHTISQSTDVPTVAQAGRLFNYSLLIDCTTADATLAASDQCSIGQNIEGFNWLPLAQRTVTLSFWVKATKTGIYCATLSNSGLDRSFVREYTINAADTWELKTVTFDASPTAGTWSYTTGVGARVIFALAAGTDFQGTAGAWNSADDRASANQVNACDDVANNFRICGVQLEAGDTATEFEHRSYGAELDLCRRYYQEIGGAAFTYFGMGFNTTTGAGEFPYRLSPQMRATPTFSTAGSFLVADSSASANTTSLSLSGAVNHSADLVNIIYGSLSGAVTASAPTRIGANNDATARLKFSSEL